MKTSIISHSISEFVTSTFSGVYEPIQGIDWSKDRNNYEAKSIAKKREKFVTYDESGNFIEVEMAMEVSALPASVIKYVKKNYKEDEVKEASEIIEANGTVTYKAELKGLDLFFNSKGNFVKSIKN
jgi:hypothetical protein